MSQLDQAQREATHTMSRVATDLSSAAMSIASVLVRKKLKVEVNSAKKPSEVKNAASNAIGAGLPKKEVAQAIQDHPLATKSKNPQMFAQGMAAAGVVKRAGEVAPQQALTKQKKQTKSL